MKVFIDFIYYLEIFVAEGLIADRRKGEAVSDLQTGVRDQAEQSSLSDSKVRKVHLVAVLDQLHHDLKQNIICFFILLKTSYFQSRN